MRMPMENQQSKIIYEHLGFKINGILYKTQNELGRYCNEKQYCDRLAVNFKIAEIPFEREVVVPPSFVGELPGRNKVDFVIEGLIPLEVKAKRFVTKEDYYQMRRYLTALNKKLGILVNFRDQRVKPKRIINPDAQE